MATANDIYKIAITRVGKTENPPNSNSIDCNDWFYGKKVYGSAYLWCCVEICYIMHLAGADTLVKKTASSSDLYRWFKSQNRIYSEPQFGDIVFYNFSTPTAIADHVGFYIGTENGRIKVYEGNTSFDDKGSQSNGGAITIKSRSTSKVVGYGRPNYSNSAQSPTVDNTNSNKPIVDISTFNTITNYSAMAKDVSACIIRLGYRSYGSGNLMLDAKYQQHMLSCGQNGIPLGVYFLSQAITTQEATEEADYVVKMLCGYKPQLPIFIDSEYSNKNHNGRADALSKVQRTAITIAFCERLKQWGYVPGVYASESWFKTNLDFEQLRKYYIWCAKYSKSGTPPNIPKYDAWQYSNAGTFSWCTGNIDLSKLNNDKTTVEPTYKIGNTYTLLANMFVRVSPGGQKKLLSQFTSDGKKHAYSDSDGYGIMKKGTRITCQEIQTKDNAIWMRAPSGWICAKSGNDIYIE